MFSERYRWWRVGIIAAWILLRGGMALYWAGEDAGRREPRPRESCHVDHHADGQRRMFCTPGVDIYDER